VYVLVICNNLDTVEAKTKYKDFYTTYDGTILTKDEFIQRSIYCQGMKIDGLIEPVNCHEWVLTEEGEQKITDYILEKNDIDTAEEKIDFWLKQLD
jgi:hypothetical protein